ncbi:DNA replication/repair protein RecF [Vreelandella utahensis]|uniref:DNA replication/repair protein RecF n=1 Tax=Vreelandella halophila TaxID=86177 RepID=UPI000986666D|nr:DNA replication/repair protein RecF [Halomonas utahensis]
MALTELHVHHFRNIEQQKLQFSSGLNLIHGANGSGKTSLLEAIYYLSTARSFRTSNHRRVVQEGCRSLTLFGNVTDPLRGSLRIGLERQPGDANGVRLQRNGEAVRSVSELARLLPVSVIEPGTFELVAGGPGNRRRFLDWLVFHVEHWFSGLWQEVQRALKQRNHLLRHGIIDQSSIGPWNARVADLGERLNQGRQAGFDRFYSEFEAIRSRSQAEWLGAVSLAFNPGWDSSESLGSILESNLEAEARAGFSLYGPNRADIRIRVGKQPAGEVLSRGQQRSLVVLMKLAQMRVLQAVGTEGICLLDDIHAELDGENQALLASELLALNTQVFLTGITAPNEGALGSLMHKHEPAMFHVEHGRFTEQ